MRERGGSKMGQSVFEDDDDDRKTHCCDNREKNICVEDWSSFPSEEFCPIRMIIEKDDADKFDSFLRKSKLVYRKDDEMLKYAGFEMCPYGILGKICHHRAYKCATLLLSRRRKVGSLMKLNIINCYGSYPIHDAAISLSASLVKLFLDHGASLDARSLDAAGISPLEYAVERLSCDRNLIPWSPRKSPFKLIITLCLPQMKEALETIDLLAGVSSASLVMNDTIFSAVKRGQVVPVAVLLLLARDRVMQSFYDYFTVYYNGRCLLFSEAIMNELAALINQESALMGSKEHAKILQLCREKKELMIYLLQMIEIFNRAGPALKSYLKERTSDVTNEQVSYHVAELLEGAGFILSTDDRDISDITSLDSSPKPDLVPLEATLKQQGYDEEDDPKGIFFKPCCEQLCRCNMRMPSCTTSIVFQRIVGTSFLYSHHRGFSSRAGPSIHQLPWMIPRRDICFLTRSPNAQQTAIFSDLEQKIVKSFSKKDYAVYKNYFETFNLARNGDAGLFLSLSKVSMLIFGRPEFWGLSSETARLFDVNAPIVDGMFPLHLAVMTSSRELVAKLVDSYRAKLDVKCCGDPDSPFYGLTPLEMALKLMRNLIPWAPQMSVHELLSMFHGNKKVKSLMVNISILVTVTPRIRHLIAEYSLQGKVVEFAALLKVACSYSIDFLTMYIPTANIPPELYFGVPIMLRLLVATRSASLIKEGIQLSASLNPEEYDNYRIKIKQMDCIRTLLESAERGDLNGFDVKQQLTVELTDGSSEGSQDESKVSTIAPQYLKNSLLYVEPSKFQPAGVFNSLMPRGYEHSLRNYDGLDIRNCNALAEAIFRVLDGRKVEEFSLEDTCRFKYRLERCLGHKFKEAETLTALENKGPKQLAFKHLDVKKISSSVFSAIKKGKP